MVVGCMIFFNEAWILRKTLTALKERVDRVVAVDGPYAAFPHQHHNSTDSSLEIAMEIANTVIFKGDHWEDEVEKRNKYLELCHEGDWVFVVDADEEMTGEIGELKGDAYRIPIVDGKWGTSMELFRVFKMGMDTVYRGTHFSLFQGSGLRNNEPMPILSNPKLLHHRMSRPPERSNLKGAYLKWLAKHEEEFRAKYNPLT